LVGPIITPSFTLADDISIISGLDGDFAPNLIERCITANRRWPKV